MNRRGFFASLVGLAAAPLLPKPKPQVTCFTYVPHENRLVTMVGHFYSDEYVGHRHRLICAWRGRTVLSKLPRDSRNWFMSAVDKPTNFAPAEARP